MTRVRCIYLRTTSNSE